MLSYASSDQGYVDLRKKVVQRLNAERIPQRLSETLEKSFAAVLADENIIVSRAARQRLLNQVIQDILGDLLKEIESR